MNISLIISTRCIGAIRTAGCDMDLYVMNQDFEWLDIVEGAESKVWKKSFSGAGEFEIYTTDTPENIELLQIGRYVVRQDDDMVGIIEKINMQKDED